MKNLIGLIVIVLLASSCAVDSKITSSWKKPKFKGSYSDVMVVALTHNVDSKSAIENDLSAALTGKGVLVSKSLEIFPPTFTKEIKREEMLRRIRGTSSKAIITVSLIHKETQSNYVPGSYGPAPYTYYGRFWGYYSFWSPTVMSPGYYTQDQVYYLETNVFDVATEELVWSAQSETYNPENVSGFSSELANSLAARLVKEGVLKPPMKLTQPGKGKDITSKK